MQQLTMLGCFQPVFYTKLVSLSDKSRSKTSTQGLWWVSLKDSLVRPLLEPSHLSESCIPISICLTEEHPHLPLHFHLPLLYPVTIVASLSVSAVARSLSPSITVVVIVFILPVSRSITHSSVVETDWEKHGRQHSYFKPQGILSVWENLMCDIFS